MSRPASGNAEVLPNAREATACTKPEAQWRQAPLTRFFPCGRFVDTAVMEVGLPWAAVRHGNQSRCVVISRSFDQQAGAAMIAPPDHDICRQRQLG